MSVLRRLVSRITARLAALADTSGDSGGIALNLISPAQIESLGRLRLTPGARVLDAEARTSARLETHFTARLEIAPARLDDFLAGTLVRGPLSADASALPRDVVLRARGMRSFLAGRAAQGNLQQIVVVDTGDAARCVVHIFTHSR